jgi:glycosyltransferase involved in cell wall biosynthesis
MKLIVLIPCLDEEQTLKGVIHGLPSSINGVSTIETLVVDDGSTDATSLRASELGVHHLITLPKNLGLASAFSIGLERCKELNADIVVNIDGDLQYEGIEIPKLIAPILSGASDIIIGDRSTWSLPHFSLTKRVLQAIGTLIVNITASTHVADATCGFRAFNRTAIERITIHNKYSHTIETIIQSQRKGLKVTSIPIRANPPVRPSRLMSSLFSYVVKQGMVILSSFWRYRLRRS